MPKTPQDAWQSMLSALMNMLCRSRRGCTAGCGTRGTWASCCGRPARSCCWPTRCVWSCSSPWCAPHPEFLLPLSFMGNCRWVTMRSTGQAVDRSTSAERLPAPGLELISLPYTALVRRRHAAGVGVLPAPNPRGGAAAAAVLWAGVRRLSAAGAVRHSICVLSPVHVSGGRCAACLPITEDNDQVLCVSSMVSCKWRGEAEAFVSEVSHWSLLCVTLQFPDTLMTCTYETTPKPKVECVL